MCELVPRVNNWFHQLIWAWYKQLKNRRVCLEQLSKTLGLRVFIRELQPSGDCVAMRRFNRLWYGSRQWSAYGSLELIWIHVMAGVEAPMESLNTLRQGKQAMLNDPSAIDAFAIEGSRIE